LGDFLTRTDLSQGSSTAAGVGSSSPALSLFPQSSELSLNWQTGPSCC